MLFDWRLRRCYLRCGDAAMARICVGGKGKGQIRLHQDSRRSMTDSVLPAGLEYPRHWCKGSRTLESYGMHSQSIWIPSRASRTALTRNRVQVDDLLREGCHQSRFQGKSLQGGCFPKHRRRWKRDIASKPIIPPSVDDVFLREVE